MKIVITGTSRGIGLELTRRALEHGHEVLAIARSPEESSELMAFTKEFPTLKTLKLDILDKNSLETLSQGLKDWSVVDVLINNAGIYREDEKREDYELSFLTNAIMPLLITKSLLPKLKESKRPVALEITSQMGSIADNTSGGSYSYRASKAAMNMLFKSLAVD